MRMAASSPVWFTRRAEERKARCWGERVRTGLEVWEEASEESLEELGEIGAFALGGGGGWCDVLWCRREVLMVLGARKSYTGCWMVRGVLRANTRMHKTAEDMVLSYCTTDREKACDCSHI